MHSNENHSKTRKTPASKPRTTAQQERRDKVKTWARTDKRTAWA